MGRARLMVGLVALGALGGCDGGAATGHPGEQIYNRYCFSCHAAGVAGAPRVGDPEAWQARLANGRAALLQSTIEGISPGMPPRGLCSECSDAQLREAIDYMIERSIPAER